MLDDILKSAERMMTSAVEVLATTCSRSAPAAPPRAARPGPGRLLRHADAAQPGGDITAPEPRLSLVQPWDRSMLGPIEKAIQKSDLGLNPNNDGR